MVLFLILLFCLLGSALSVGLAGLILLLGRAKLKRVTVLAVSYATGTLLGAAFLGMIPHALHHTSSDRVLPAVLIGVLLFFALEKLAIWRHCHKKNCDIHSAAGFLILVGDSLHNFVDGVAIAVAFSESVSLGIATSVAVITHEVPQELGDFAILIESGYSRGRAFAYNLLSSLFALLGAVLAYHLLIPLQKAVPYALSLSAASFIYIALADLIPSHRRETGLGTTALELGLIVLGIGTIALLSLHQH